LLQIHRTEPTKNTPESDIPELSALTPDCYQCFSRIESSIVFEGADCPCPCSHQKTGAELAMTDYRILKARLRASWRHESIEEKGFEG
jgi:hypothetical protein